MKLYYAQGACSLAVRIIINEIGLKSEFISVDLKNKKTENNEDYLKINAKGAVPALLTNDDHILTENAIILQFLADSAKATQLLPQLGEFKRYRVLEWLNYVATELHKSCGLLFNPNFSEEIKTKFVRPLIVSKISYVDKHLAQNKYLLGENYTLPDTYLFVITNWLHHFKFDMNEWPHLSRHFSELTKRPAIHKSLEEEGLPVTTA